MAQAEFRFLISVNPLFLFPGCLICDRWQKEICKSDQNYLTKKQILIESTQTAVNLAPKLP